MNAFTNVRIATEEHFYLAVEEMNKDFDSRCIDVWEDGKRVFCAAFDEEIELWNERLIAESIQPDSVNVFAGEKVPDAINPSHYKEVVPGMQYMQMMQYMLAQYTGVEAHLMGHIYKYLMRNGKKDDELQELRKALWYLKCLVLYKETGKVHVDLDV